MIMKSHANKNVAEKITSNRKLDELILPASKLRFCSEQLHNLNFLFRNKLTKNSLTREEKDKNHLLARSVTERLIQRLVCGAGTLDSRFCSKFLVPLHDQNDTNSTNLQYLIRLDALSTPRLYDDDPIPTYRIIEGDPEYPRGYARIQLQSASYKVWGEYANSGGFLRRDRIQARLVELLAKAAGGDEPTSPLQVDESILCGSPGKIVDAVTLQHILRVPSGEHVFYGTGGTTPRFPDPRDFRLAIVDEPDGIRLRVEFLSPALANISMNVRLLVAVGVDAWPTSTDFPFRISLGHSDCLLYYRSAQTGMFLVGYGVQSSAWQIRFPAAESTLLNHYNFASTIRTVLEALLFVLGEMHEQYDRRKQQMTYKILNQYILRTLLFYELEKDRASPTTVILNWSPLYLSTHILKILDRLIVSLRRQFQPNYFFDKANLLVNPGHLCEDDYFIEASKIHQYLLRLFDESLMSTKSNQDFQKTIVSINTEMMLLTKWKEIIDGLSPAPSTRGRRMCLTFYGGGRELAFTQYTRRQLEYIGFLLKNMLTVRENVWQDTEDLWCNSENDHAQGHPIEDIIYLLVTIMEQARDAYLETCANPKIKPKLKLQFNISTAKIVELVRKDRDITYTNIVDDVNLVKIILKWLYKGMDQDKKYLAPVLRPYLNTIFNTSHAISWHLEAAKKWVKSNELEALGAFAKLVNLGKITPAYGLVDAVNKNWIWAKEMLRVVEDGNLRLILVSERGRVLRHILSLPVCKSNLKKLERGSFEGEMNTSTSFTGGNYFNTLLSRCELRRNNTYLKLKAQSCLLVFPFCQLAKSLSSFGNVKLEVRSLLTNLEPKEKDCKRHFPAQNSTNSHSSPQHCILKITSPMTSVLKHVHRRGNHRCYGDIFETLITMHKANVVQEISHFLPNEERTEILEAIQKLSNEKNRKVSTRKLSKTLPSLPKSSRSALPKFAFGEEQKYTPMEESAGIRIAKNNAHVQGDGRQNLNEIIKKLNKSDSLLGSCRAARIREDNSIAHFHENFRIKALNVRQREVIRKELPICSAAASPGRTTVHRGVERTPMSSVGPESMASRGVAVARSIQRCADAASLLDSSDLTLATLLLRTLREQQGTDALVCEFKSLFDDVAVDS